ncbi:MAG: thioredoxin fold domain-containing protein [Ignavibacteria bacterium]|nr:thioredoxin fold domain-containing protein [Ignavibacteria bacterium]
MKTKILPILSIALILIISYFALTANGNSNNSNDKAKGKSFEEILKLAKKDNKKVLINVYADWCSWCKKMEKDTYPDSEVQKELNRNYYLYRLNGESKETIEYDGRKWTKAELTAAFGIRGFPATIFLNSNSKPITVLPGYVDAKTFASILKYIGDDLYTKMTFEEFMKGKKN